MGVTLERVQNKFACIIGELSHDPDILSQFAIWVDLRIAEYKAKGAISLECTGDDPNPTWLRGHKKSFLKGKLPRMTVRCQTEPLNHPEPFNEQFTQEAEERLSPDIVVVKNEPGTDIFPVNVHANSSTVNAVSSSRKRPSSSSYSPEDLDHTSQLPLKLGKHSSSPAVLEPMNQSLMSIISKCESLDESGEMSDSTANPAQDSASVAGMGDNSMCMPSASTGSTENPDNSSPGHRLTTDLSRWEHPPSNSSPSGGRRGVYKTYTEARMMEALALVQAGKLNQKAASRVFDIPLRTLTYRLRKLHDEAANDR